MKLTEFMLIASPDDLSLLKQWRDKADKYDALLYNTELIILLRVASEIANTRLVEKAHNWDLLEQLPPDTRLTRTQIGWMIEYPDGETCKHERTASACVNTYWKHHEKKD